MQGDSNSKSSLKSSCGLRQPQPKHPLWGHPVQGQPLPVTSYAVPQPASQPDTPLRPLTFMELLSGGGCWSPPRAGSGLLHPQSPCLPSFAPLVQHLWECPVLSCAPTSASALGQGAGQMDGGLGGF